MAKHTEAIEKYNRDSSERFGWRPEDFCCHDFGEYLTAAVAAFQRSLSIKEDGKVGPMTYTRLKAMIESQGPAKGKIIFCNTKPVSIDWGKVDTDKFLVPKSCYRAANRKEVSQIILHWDAALSTQSCYDILVRGKKSYHFGIDNDGTIFQFTDTKNVAWHAGTSNSRSIGINLSNAFYTKYQSTYERRGFGPRPIITSDVHGKSLGQHLGFYDIQIEALEKLLSVLCETYNIPLVCPMDRSGKLISAVHEPSVSGDFKGVLNHFNVTRGKIDPSGLDLVGILSKIA